VQSGEADGASEGASVVEYFVVGGVLGVRALPPPLAGSVMVCCDANASQSSERGSGEAMIGAASNSAVITTLNPTPKTSLV
jgi:hypothetical protein